MVSDALKSLGMELYTNTSISDNVYYDLFGYNEDGTLLPPTGSEVIKSYVTSSLPTGSMGSKQIQQEIYKRIYHNLPYLLKSRGTQRAVKALISIYGIPSNILTVNEFGGYSRYTVDGVNEINNNKITGVTSSLYLSSSLLSPYTTLQYYQNNNRLNSTNIEVGFSIADILNDNITSSLGYFNIDNLIGNPNDQYSSSYISLVSASDAYFASYTQPHSVWEYIRLIKYFNNSLFKTIKDFVPARANVSTGIIVKSHILERNKYARHEPSASIDQISQSIDMLTLSAEPGNIFSGSNTNWSYDQVTPLGYVPVSSSQDVEKLTGEFGGTEIVVTNGDALSQLENSNGTLGSIGPISVNLGALYQNITGSVRSQKYLDLDYTTNQLTPINLGLITQSIENSVNDNYNTYTNPNNPYAQLQDYNYATRHFTDPRYYGSNTISATYNTYTSGDNSYGKTAAIDKIKYQYAYLVDIYSASRYLPERSNAQIKYLIDNNQNVLDLTKTNKNIFDVQNVYKSGENVDISLFKYDEKNPYSQQLANNPTLKIYEGGFRYLPMLHNIGSTTPTNQGFYLSKLITSTLTQEAGGGGGGTTDDANYTNPLNWNLFWWSKQTITEPGSFPACTSNYEFYVSASYIGPSLSVTPTYGITISAISSLNAGAGDCSQTNDIFIILAPGATQGVTANSIQTLEDFTCSPGSGGSTSGGSAFAGAFWPPYSVPNCSITDVGILVRGGGGGSTGGSSTFTSYTTYVSASQPCVYFLSQSNELVFNATMSFYYTNYGITFDSTTDPAFAGSGLDTVILPFTIQTGDKFSFYNSQSLGWNELFEYTVKSTRITGSNNLSGSRLLVELDSPVNLALFASGGASVPTESLTRTPFRTCRYIFWKHVPDETNVMLRYNPQDSRIVEEGLLFPQYISEVDKANSGNTIKSLRSQNLLPPSP